MRQLILKNKQHKTLEHDFKTWLETLGYGKFSIESSPIYVREFLYWLEGQHSTIKEVNEQTLPHYFEYLSKRPNQRRAGGLSNDYLNAHLTSLKQLSEYLQHSKGESFIVQMNYYPSTNLETILTRDQITALYEVTGKDTALALRDRAILALYYGCGLRRNEGVQVNVEDVQLRGNVLYVRKGKQNRERYVPLAKHVKEDLENYLTIARPLLPHHEREEAFLLGRRGRIGGYGILQRIKYLGKKADIRTDFGLHTLRHSIATHLLQAGMPLEQIAKFLGHTSLESTQRYAHIVANLLP